MDRLWVSTFMNIKCVASWKHSNPFFNSLKRGKVSSWIWITAGFFNMESRCIDIQGGRIRAPPIKTLWTKRMDFVNDENLFMKPLLFKFYLKIKIMAMALSVDRIKTKIERELESPLSTFWLLDCCRIEWFWLLEFQKKQWVAKFPPPRIARQNQSKMLFYSLQKGQHRKTRVEWRLQRSGAKGGAPEALQILGGTSHLCPAPKWRGYPGGRHLSATGVAEATFYVWKKKYAHLEVSELRRLLSWKKRTPA